MKKSIAILGTGMVARTLAERLSGLGYNCYLGTRDVEANKAKNKELQKKPRLLVAHACGVELHHYRDAAAKVIY